MSIDTLRPDHLGCYGYSRDTSPNLDRLASEGVVFERAYSTAPWTLPAHVSMLTGLFAAEHGVTNTRLRLRPEQLLLPEVLAGLGYTSAAAVSTIDFLKPRYGLAQGWKSYDSRTAFPRGGEKFETFVASRRLLGRASSLLDELGDGPFFLFLHDYDVHHEYVAPPPFDVMFGAARGTGGVHGWDGREDRAAARAREMPRYDAEIRWVDHEIGELVLELGRRRLLDRTAIAVVSDHGEEFFEHGDWRHGRNLYDTTLRAAWILRLPGARHAGRRIVAPVSLVDLPATLLALAGGPQEGWRSGRNLMRWIESGGEPSDPEPLYADLRRLDAPSVTAIVYRGYKAIFRADTRGRPLAPAIGLFRLADDPREERDLSRELPAMAEQLRARLERGIERQLRRGRPGPAPLAPLRKDPEGEAALRALGYL